MNYEPRSLFLALGALALLLGGCAHQVDPTPRVDLTPLGRSPKIVRVGPDFTFQGAHVRSLRGLRGQAVVLIIADAPRTKAFRKQLFALEHFYTDYASRQTVFIAAFKDGSRGPVNSNLPFAVANDGAAVAAAYSANEDMNVVIIGKDGNVDYQTPKIVPGERVRDVIQNSYAVQVGMRH